MNASMQTDDFLMADFGFKQPPSPIIASQSLKKSIPQSKEDPMATIWHTKRETELIEFNPAPKTKQVNLFQEEDEDLEEQWELMNNYATKAQHKSITPKQPTKKQQVTPFGTFDTRVNSMVSSPEKTRNIAPAPRVVKMFVQHPSNRIQNSSSLPQIDSQKKKTYSRFIDE